jgi:hypothetical protein
MELDILFVNKERSFNEIAIVFVRYYEAVFRCKLVVGVTPQRTLYHYIMMPFITSKEKIAGTNRPSRVNVVNWPNEHINKVFQAKCLEILKERYPDLFSNCVEEVEAYLDERKKSIQDKRSRKPAQVFKAKNAPGVRKHAPK